MVVFRIADSVASGSKLRQDSFMPNDVGRPLVTLDDLAPNWRDIMHAIYNDGGSDAELKVALAIAPSRP